MNKKVKVCSVILIAFVLFAGTIFAVGLLVNKQVNGFIAGLADKLSQQVGHPVTLAKINTKWQGLRLRISIDDITITDKDSRVPLCTVKKLVGLVDVIDTITSLQVKFKNIHIQNPRFAVQWDGIDQITIAGLNNNQSADNNDENKLDPIPLLQFLAVQKRIIIENGDLHIQGLQGADIPLMNVKLDFKKISNFEYQIISRGSVAAAVQPEFNLAAQYHGSLDNLSNYLLDFEIKTSNVQLKDLFHLLPQYQHEHIVGDFATLDFKGAIQNGQLRFLNSDFNIDQIAVGDNIVLPSGIGHIEYKPERDKIHVAATNLQVQHKQIFSKAIQFDEIKGDIYNQKIDDFFDLRAEDLEIKLYGMDLKPRVLAKWNTDKIDNIEFETNIQAGYLSSVLNIVPDRYFPQGLTTWLNSSLIAGNLNKIIFKQQLQHTFLEAEFLNAEIKFAKEWPSVQGVDATLVLNDNQLLIEASKASVHGTKINNLNAEFKPYKDNPFGLLLLTGDINTNLATGLDYLRLTPLHKSLGAKLAPLSPNGPIRMALALNVKMHDGSVDTFGQLELQNASLKIPNINLPITGITGIVNFSPKDIHGKDIQLEMLGQKTTAQMNLDKQKAKELQIGFKLPVKIDALRPYLPTFKLDQIQGATTVATNIQIPWDNPTADKCINITTNMQGVSLDYPPPFKKSAQEKLALQLKYFIKDSDDRILALKAANWLDANLVLKDSNISGGHIVFGPEKATLKHDKLLISGRLANFIWEDWQQWFTSNSTAGMPLEVDVFIDNLVFRGEKYASMGVKYYSPLNRFVFNSPIINGSIQIAKDEDKIDVKLSKLIFENQPGKSDALLEQIKQKNQDKTLPLVQFYCENLRYNKQEFRKVSLQLLPRPYGYEISDLSVSNDNLLLQAQGQWQMDNKEYTQLSGNAYTKNLGKVLREFGYPTSITKGKGELNFTLQWDGAPTQVNLLKLDGNSHVELQSGNIASINPGLGRIIGLLSLDAIQRRLQLDFSDVISKGFTFDRLVSDIKMQPGVLASENIVIQSPSARIELTGKSNLKGRELDFTMYVTPKVGVGLPVAAAIAVGNPAIGAALWLFDHASGLKISEITRYKYKITGTWDAPKINEIEDKSSG